jgi:hypothetical protein
MSIFSGVDLRSFSDVRGLAPLLSAAEMLSSRFPTISNSFIQYSISLIQRHSILSGQPSRFDTVLNALNGSANSPSASADDLERFGDSLQSAAIGNNAIDLRRLAYFAYAAISAIGPLSPDISAKLSQLEKGFNVSPYPDIDLPPSFAGNASPGFSEEEKTNFAEAEWKNEPGTIGEKVKELSELALGAFNAGASDIALAALIGAISELKVT